MDVVTMPQLGETVTEGTITAWSKGVGDEVGLDDALFEVSTEKVDTEVPSAVVGFLRAILVAEGDTVPVGTAVAVITPTADEPVDLVGVDGAGSATAAPDPGSTGPAPAEPGRPAPDGPAAEPVGDESTSIRRNRSGRGRDATGSEAEPSGEMGARRDESAPIRRRHDRDGVGRSAAAVLTPVVRRLLDHHGLDPDDVAGSGRDGRITRADVLAAAAQADRWADDRRRGRAPGPSGGQPVAPAPAPAGPRSVDPVGPALEPGDDDEVVELSRARLATAEHMARSLATAAHALVAVEVDYAALEPVRRAAGLSYLPFVARAVIDAVREFPHVNAGFDGDRLIVHRRVHLGVAVDVDREALVVPVLRGADDLRLPALAAAVADLADRARRRRLPGDAFTGGTFTLTNVGSYGTFVTAPIINQPQVAILSTDGVRMAPVAVRTDDGSPGTERAWGVAVHPVGNLCLSFDHRAFDGAYAAAFLARVRALLQTRDWRTEVAG